MLTASDSAYQTIIPEEVLLEAESRELAAAPQVVYLDFDGATTSYRNRDQIGRAHV